MLTLGSLFDGSGGFPLAAQMCGVKPIWSSEIEPFPILVTSKRFPEMKHYGDVSKLSGAELEPVDIITFGSPCQDLSIAGKRAGMEGERSGLFFQAIGKPKTKKKTREQMRKWLADPYSDSAMYKMWGNGVALPCVLFVISGIVEVTRDNAINT